jgi:hypothetical protein
VNASEKQDAVARVLNSSEMASAPRARDFLRYVVEEEIGGRADLLKGYTIATEALGRREAFDADLQSAVRVQARRLREILSVYYDGSGKFDPVIIEIPLGAYVPVFRRRTEAYPAPRPDAWPAVESAEPPLDAQKPADLEPQSPANAEPATGPKAAGGWKLRAAIGAAVVLAPAAIAIGLGAGRWTSEPIDDLRRHISVAAASPVDPALRPSADAFLAALKSRLSDFDESVLNDAPEGGRSRSYKLRIAFSPGDADGMVSYKVSLTSPDGDVLYGEQNTLAARCAAMFECAGRLAAKVAGPYGLIYMDALKNDLKVGRDCVIESFEYFRRPSLGDLGAVEACLRAEVARRPFDLPAITALSRILLQQYRLGVKPSDGGDPIAAADALALRALELGPEKSRAFKSIFEVRFFQRRYDEAFKAADRAIEINPFAADILFRVGAARIARGESGKGKALLDRGAELNPAPPHWIAFFVFLEAFERSDESAAARAADAPGTETAPLGLLARAIVADQRKDPDAKQQDLRALAKAFPTVAADIPGALERYGLTAPLRQKLLAALNPGPAGPQPVRRDAKINAPG